LKKNIAARFFNDIKASVCTFLLENCIKAAYGLPACLGEKT
jgi:hypothetical protein